MSDLDSAASSRQGPAAVRVVWTHAGPNRRRMSARRRALIASLADPSRPIIDHHGRRPRSAKCGELMVAPESSEYLSGDEVRHIWICDGCDYPFETLIRFNVAGA
jgi:hypothetical protein